MATSDDIDLSNFGRCDLCGEPIDLRDAGDEMVMWERTDDHEDFGEAIAEALRRCGGDPMTLNLAEMLEERGMAGVILHQRCLDETAFAEMAAGSRVGTEWEGDGDRELAGVTDGDQ